MILTFIASLFTYDIPGTALFAITFVMFSIVNTILFLYLFPHWNDRYIESTSMHTGSDVQFMLLKKCVIYFLGISFLFTHVIAICVSFPLLIVLCVHSLDSNSLKILNVRYLSMKPSSYLRAHFYTVLLSVIPIGVWVDSYYKLIPVITD